MARIAFFTESLPPHDDLISRFSFDLIWSLADQQHDIRVFSTYRPEDSLPNSHTRIEILRPFKKWSWLEIPRAIPLLFQFQPEIIHIIQPRAEALSGFTNAMSLLPGIAATTGQSAVISSFYDLRAETLKAQRMLFLASDTVTVSNESQAELLRTHFDKNNWKTWVKVLPISASLDRDSETSEEAELETTLNENMQAYFQKFPRVIVIPGDLDGHNNLEALFTGLSTVLNQDPRCAVLFAGNWGQVPLRQRQHLMRQIEQKGMGQRILLSGPLSPELQRICLRAAHVVFVASLPTESLLLTRVMRQALATSAVLIMNTDQAALDPLHWRDRENAFFTGHDLHDWTRSLSEALLSEELVKSIQSRLLDFARSEALDLPGNFMSRIYSDLLTRKRRF